MIVVTKRRERPIFKFSAECQLCESEMTFDEGDFGYTYGLRFFRCEVCHAIIHPDNIKAHKQSADSLVSLPPDH